MNRLIKLPLILIVALSLNSGCQHTASTTDLGRQPAQSSEEKSLLHVFDAARKIFKEASGKKKSDLNSLGESKVIEILMKENLLKQEMPLDKLTKEVLSYKSKSSPEDITRLPSLNPQGGYYDVSVTVSHPYYRGSKLIPAGDLRKTWKDFIASAKKQLILNVFEFDLEIIAQELVKKANSGVQVIVGVDSKNVVGDSRHEVSPEAKRVFQLLSKSKVQFVPVETTALNHQKMVAIDWENPAEARVLFSSGNLTQSCLGPEGDLVDIPALQRPKESIPNANHVITMSSGILAQLVHHELTKTLSKEYFYRGKQFPASGAYQVSGPTGTTQSLVISFTPGGSFNNVNKNLIAPLIRKTEGPMRMIQFAFSSDETGLAILDKAQKDFRMGNFDFMAVGEAAFSMQSWSEFLIMSGLKVSKDGKALNYEDDATNPWYKALKPNDLKTLRTDIYVAPENYKNNNIKINGVNRTYGAVVHHKVLSVGPYAVLGTSFNLSDSAETNHEQILIFKDPQMAEIVDGMTRFLAEKSRTVYDDALRRNDLKK